MKKQKNWRDLQAEYEGEDNYWNDIDEEEDIDEDINAMGEVKPNNR